MLDHMIVGLIVLMAVGYTAWKLAPRAVRRVLAVRVAHLLRVRAGVSPQRVIRIEQRIAGSACGACETCGGCASGSAESAP